MCKIIRTIECTIQMQSQFWIVHWIALTGIEHVKKYSLRIQAFMFFKLLILSSRPPQQMGTLLGNVDSQVGKSVRVREGCFMVETF